MRPTKFSQVIGQDMLVNLITKSLQANKLPRTLILHGPSGVGKTTIARLIAEYFVCQNKQPDKMLSQDVCGQCEMCQAVQSGTLPDILEFDAASNTSVEDIRNILEQSNYVPQYGKEKIFIIDEAHMLSRSAISAMLKSLEETKKHLYFIMATTAIEKISDAIKSRCLCLALRSIDENAMNQYLENYKKENEITIDENSQKLLINLSNGSLREVLSLLKQVTLLSNKIDFEILRSILLFLDIAQLEELTYLIRKRKYIQVYEMLLDIMKNNVCPFSLLQQLIFHFKEQYVKKSTKEYLNEIDTYKKETIDILISLNKLYQNAKKISAFNLIIIIGLVEIAKEY